MRSTVASLPHKPGGCLAHEPCPCLVQQQVLPPYPLSSRASPPTAICPHLTLFYLRHGPGALPACRFYPAARTSFLKAYWVGPELYLGEHRNNGSSLLLGPKSASFFLSLALSQQIPLLRLLHTTMSSLLASPCHRLGVCVPPRFIGSNRNCPE